MSSGIVNQTNGEWASSAAPGMPLSRTIAIQLRTRIYNGVYKPGDDFPTEQELCREFGVSRVTVRQATGQLAEEGLIVRQRGRGTVVATSIQPSTPAFTGYLEEHMTFFMATGVSELSISEVRPPRPIAAFLGTESKVHRITRVRTSQGKPLALAVGYLPSTLVNHLEVPDFHTTSMLEYLEERCGIEVGGALESIEARLPGTEAVKKLGVRPEDPILFVQLRYFGVDGSPVALTEIAFRGDSYRYLARLGRLRGSMKP